MTDATVIEVPPRKPARRKKARRAPRQPKPAAVAAKGAAPNELGGMTAVECPLECSPSVCVISGRGYCAHPRKGGLQGSDMSDPAALDRMHRAKTAIARLMPPKGKS